jgi:acid phosphatase
MFLVLGAYLLASTSDTLKIGQQLLAGGHLVSKSGDSRLELQKTDGNLVLYNRHNKALWSAKIRKHAGDILMLQSDGNLEVVDNKQVLWTTNTSGKAVTQAVLQDDCNFELQSSTGVIWSTATHCAPPILPTPVTPSPPGPAPTPSSPTPAPPPTPVGENVSFLALGDFGFGNSGQKQVAAVMKKLATTNGLDFVVSVGDSIYPTGATSVDDPQWKSKWSSVYSGPVMEVPWYAVMGNHDWESKTSHAEIEKTKSSGGIWNMPDFFYTRSHKVGGATVAWVHLETNLIFYGPNGENAAIKANFEKEGWKTSSDVDQHLAKAEAMLKQVQGASWIFVVGHQMNLGKVCSHVGKMGSLATLFEKYGVDAYFGGHTHSLGFTESNGISYFLTGGGGQATGLCGCGGSCKRDWGSISMGVLHGSLNATDFHAAFHDSEGKVLFSHQQRRRQRIPGAMPGAEAATFGTKEATRVPLDDKRI